MRASRRVGALADPPERGRQPLLSGRCPPAGEGRRLIGLTVLAQPDGFALEACVIQLLHRGQVPIRQPDSIQVQLLHDGRRLARVSIGRCPLGHLAGQVQRFPVLFAAQAVTVVQQVLLRFRQDLALLLAPGLFRLLDDPRPALCDLFIDRGRHLVYGCDLRGADIDALPVAGGKVVNRGDVRRIRHINLLPAAEGRNTRVKGAENVLDWCPFTGCCELVSADGGQWR